MGDDPLSKERLRTWMRLLGVARATENHLRDYLRVEHATTLPRFDVLAALQRAPDGLTMSDLSRRLLVSNGNATDVVDRLEREGLVAREQEASDRRSVRVRLTASGLAQFGRMAAGHEAAVSRRFRALGDDDMRTLASILKRVQVEDRA